MEFVTVMESWQTQGGFCGEWLMKSVSYYHNEKKKKTNQDKQTHQENLLHSAAIDDGVTCNLGTGKVKQKYWKFKVSLSYIVNLKPTWAIY